MSDYVVTRKRRRTYTQAIDPCLGYYLHAASDARAGSPETIPAPNVLGVRAGKWREGTRSTVPTSFDGERELEIPSSELVRPGKTPGRRRAAGPVMADNKLCVSEHASMLTVEEFLKRSSDSERNPPLNLRRYRGKRRAGRLVLRSSPEDPNKSHSDSEGAMIRLRSRKIPRGDLADSELETSSHLMSSSPGYEPLSSSPTHESGKTVWPRKKLRQGKNLRERLYEAAVSTYGYVDPNFMDTAAAARREDVLDPQTRVKPLRFVPGSGIQQRIRSPRHQQDRRKFVDPRRSNAIRTASFLSSSKDRTARIASNSDSAVLMNVLDRLPAEKWVLDLESEGNPSAGRYLRTHRPKSTLNRKHAKEPLLTAESSRISECPPLVFVDFKQAEAAYANIFFLERNRAEGDEKASPMQQPTQLAPALKLTPLKDTHKDARSRSSIVSAPSSEHRPMKSNHSFPNLRMIGLTDCTKNNSNVDVTSQGLLDELDPEEPLYYEPALNVPPINRISKISRRRRCGDCSQTNCRMETPNPTNQARSDKPLRPLVSFMDEFFENIRNVGTRGG